MLIELYIYIFFWVGNDLLKWIRMVSIQSPLNILKNFPLFLEKKYNLLVIAYQTLQILTFFIILNISKPLTLYSVISRPTDT